MVIALTIISLLVTAGSAFIYLRHSNQPEPSHMSSYLIYIAVALAGYFLRHYHISIPFLPGSSPASPTPSVPPQDPTAPKTGRPILDILVAQLLAGVTDPVARAAIIAEAEAIKKMLDAANVPSIPIASK